MGAPAALKTNLGKAADSGTRPLLGTGRLLPSMGSRAWLSRLLYLVTNLRFGPISETGHTPPACFSFLRRLQSLTNERACGLLWIPSPVATGLNLPSLPRKVHERMDPAHHTGFARWRGDSPAASPQQLEPRLSCAGSASGLESRGRQDLRCPRSLHARLRPAPVLAREPRGVPVGACPRVPSPSRPSPRPPGAGGPSRGHPCRPSPAPAPPHPGPVAGVQLDGPVGQLHGALQRLHRAVPGRSGHGAGRGRRRRQPRGGTGGREPGTQPARVREPPEQRTAGRDAAALPATGPLRAYFGPHGC